MLAIAILSLIGFIFGILFDMFMSNNKNASARACLCAIMVISWWNISFPFAIILLVLSSFWIIVCLITHKQ